MTLGCQIMNDFDSQFIYVCVSVYVYYLKCFILPSLRILSSKEANLFFLLFLIKKLTMNLIYTYQKLCSHHVWLLGMCQACLIMNDIEVPNYE